MAPKVHGVQKLKKNHTKHQETVLQTPKTSLKVSLLPLQFQDDL